MTTTHHASVDTVYHLVAMLDRYAEAGIDPAFDAEMDDLERQFAELRVTSDHN